MATYNVIKQKLLEFFEEHANEDGTTGPVAQKELATEIGLSATTVSFGLSMLTDAGAVEVVRTHRPGGTVYRIGGAS